MYSLRDRRRNGALLFLSTPTPPQKPRAGYITVGLKASLTRSFDASAVASFADLAGDDNPVHLDAAYAAGTRFKRCLRRRRWPTRARMSARHLATWITGASAIFVEKCRACLLLECITRTMASNALAPDATSLLGILPTCARGLSCAQANRARNALRKPHRYHLWRNCSWRDLRVAALQILPARLRRCVRGRRRSSAASSFSMSPAGGLIVWRARVAPSTSARRAAARFSLSRSRFT